MRLFLLQTDLSYFGSGFNKPTPVGVYIFIGVLLVFVVIMIVVTSRQKKNPSAGSGGSRTGGAGSFNPLANFALHNQLKNMGLNHEQIKMMDYIFRQDNVTNPRHSLETPALLDRHFRKAYRGIERSSGTDEEAQQRLRLLFSARNVLDAQPGSATTSTRQIPENSAAVLGFNKENYPVKVLSTKGEQLVVENPKAASGSNITLPRGSKVTLAFFTRSSKGFSFESRVAGNSESGGASVLQLVHSNQVKTLSKRRFRRRQVVISTFFYFVNLVDSGRKEKKMIVDKRRLSGNIMDISIGGCSIKTNVSVASGARLKIEADCGGTTIAALGQVLRTNRTGTKSILHISFLKVPLRSLNTINAIVFEYLDD